jgi:precorrin-2 dehydrogenase/sirohydrochlorin ferrochelatase
VAGAGVVALRKARALIRAGGKVYVISKNLKRGLAGLKKKKEIFHIPSEYRKKHLKGACLVIAATNNSRVNARISKDAQALQILTNVVDSPELSSFIVPSSIRKGDLIISISTSGKAPGLSKRIRKDLKALLVPDYARFLRELQSIRADLRQRCAKPRLRRMLMHCLVNAGVPPPERKRILK